MAFLILHGLSRSAYVPGGSGSPTRTSRTRQRRGSTDDPWCAPERSQALADAVGAPVDWLSNAGHVNADSGFGPWPALEAWCLGERPSPVSGV